MSTNRNVVAPTKKGMEPRDRVMQLKDKYSGRLIGNIPASCAKTVDECIKYLGGKLTNNADGQPQRNNDKEVIIRDELYVYDSLVITERAISAARIDSLVDDTRHYSNAECFVSDCAQGLNFMDPETKELDMVFIEQLGIFWHVVRDSFADLLEKLGMTAADCSVRFCVPMNIVQEWLSGETPVPHYVRLMMAEATGTLTIRNLA